MIAIAVIVLCLPDPALSEHNQPVPSNSFPSGIPGYPEIPASSSVSAPDIPADISMSSWERSAVYSASLQDSDIVSAGPPVEHSWNNLDRSAYTGISAVSSAGNSPVYESDPVVYQWNPPRYTVTPPQPVEWSPPSYSAITPSYSAVSNSQTAVSVAAKK